MFWGTQFSCSLQGGRGRWHLKVPSNANHSMIQWRPRRICSSLSSQGAHPTTLHHATSVTPILTPNGLVAAAGKGNSYPLWENKHTAHKANSTMGHPSWSYLFMSCNFLTKSLWPVAYRETELAIIREEGEAKVLHSILAPLCFEVSFMRNGNICCRELHVDPTITFTWAIDL